MFPPFIGPFKFVPPPSAQRIPAVLLVRSLKSKAVPRPRFLKVESFSRVSWSAKFATIWFHKSLVSVSPVFTDESDEYVAYPTESTASVPKNAMADKAGFLKNARLIKDE